MRKIKRKPGRVPEPEDTTHHLAFLWMVQGVSDKEIAKRLHVAFGTVRSWKSRFNWSAAIEKAQALVERSKPSKQVLAIVKNNKEISDEYVNRMHRAADKFSAHVETLDGPAIVEHAPKLDASDKMFGRRMKLDADEQAGIGGHISLTFLGTAAQNAVRVIETPAETLPLPDEKKSIDEQATVG